MAGRTIETLKRGIASHNLDLYVLFVAALVFTLLGGLSILDPAALASATLSLLAVLALSQIRSRDQLSQIASTRQVNPLSRFLVDFPPDRNDRRKICKDWLYVGLSMIRIAQESRKDISRIIRSGGRVRLLLLDPTNDMLVRAVDEGSAVPEGRESLAARIEGVLSDLLQLKNLIGGDFEIRVSNFLPKIGAHAFDMATSAGVIVIQHWEHKSPQEPAPIFRFDRTDGYWYDHFAAELERIWDSGIEWPVSIAHRLASGSRTFMDDFGPYLVKALESSSGLFVTGVTRSHFIAEHYSLLGDLLQAGKPIRLLIADPQSSAIDVLADRNHAIRDPHRLRAAIQQTVGLSKELNRLANGLLEVRFSVHPIANGIIHANGLSDQPKDEIIFFERYTYRSSAQPKSILLPTDGKWFRQALQEAEQLWASARPLQFSD